MICHIYFILCSFCVLPELAQLRRESLEDLRRWSKELGAGDPKDSACRSSSVGYSLASHSSTRIPMGTLRGKDLDGPSRPLLDFCDDRLRFWSQSCSVD